MGPQVLERGILKRKKKEKGEENYEGPKYKKGNII